MELLTHDDLGETLPAAAFQDVFVKAAGEELAGTSAGRHWVPRWVARFSVVDSGRSVIKQLGYIVSADLR